MGNKASKTPCPYEAYMLIGDTSTKQIGTLYSILDSDECHEEKSNREGRPRSAGGAVVILNGMVGKGPTSRCSLGKKTTLGKACLQGWSWVASRNIRKVPIVPLKNGSPYLNWANRMLYAGPLLSFWESGFLYVPGRDAH